MNIEQINEKLKNAPDFKVETQDAKGYEASLWGLINS